MVNKYILKTLTIALSLMMVNVLYASFTSTGRGDNKDNVAANKYSLKLLSKYTLKPLSFNNARYTHKLSATVVNKEQFSFMNNTIQLSNGNSAFIYPYKLKIKAPKFKTPSPTSF